VTEQRVSLAKKEFALVKRINSIGTQNRFLAVKIDILMELD
jgi:hypothetical protein